jgi:molybdate transport system permease protein
MVLARDLLMTSQTKAHIKYLWVLGNRYLGHIAVTILTVLSRRDMRTMIKLNKIRHLGNRHPLKWFSTDHSLLQRRQKQAGFGLCNLVVTAPAFCLRWNASRRSNRLNLATVTVTLGRAEVNNVATQLGGVDHIGILGFAKALGEFGATITFVSNIPGETQTLALAIYALTQTPGGDAGVWRLAALSVCVSFVALVAADALARRTAVRR